MLIVDIGIQFGLEQLYFNTEDLWIYFIYVFFKTSLSFPLFWVTVIFLIYLVEIKRNKKESEEFEEPENPLDPEKKKIKWKLIAIGFIIIYCVIANFFKVSKAYEVCKINAETPSRWAYNIALLKDAASGDTEVVELNFDKINARTTTYNYTVISGRFRSRSRTGLTCYIKYENKEGSTHNAMLESEEAVTYLNKLEKLTDRIDITVKIEYYPNSGTIKYINDISPYDGEKLEAHYNSILEQYANILEKKLPNEEEEGIRQTKIILDVMPNSIGKKLSEVKSILEEECIDFEKNIDVRYLSSKSFGIGEIAFWEGKNRRIYVVEDQTEEDMVKIPFFDENTPVDEIFDMLNEAGISFTCYADKSWTRNYALDYTECTPGTMIPKNYTFTLSLKNIP